MTVLEAVLSAIAADSPVETVRAGVFWTAVVSRHCGLASTTRDDDFHHGEVPVRGAGRLTERSAAELSRLSLSDNTVEATIGVAAINSLLEVDENRCVELNAGDFLISRGAGRRVALVGHFPWVPKLRNAAKELWVLEKHPAPGDLDAADAKMVIPKADIVAISGSTVINHTIDDLLSLRPPGALVLVLGPSTPLSPVLFDYGIDVISGTKVTDTGSVLRTVAEAATFRQIGGVKLLTMARDLDILR